MKMEIYPECEYLRLVEKIGQQAADKLMENDARWQELYEYLDVERIAECTGFRLTPKSMWRKEN